MNEANALGLLGLAKLLSFIKLVSLKKIHKSGKFFYLLIR